MSNMKIWTTKDGRKIRIKDMEDGHILNTIKMLERLHTHSIEDTPFPRFQGEMAQMYAESAWESLLISDPWDYFPIIEDLANELERRKSSTKLKP